MIESVGKVPRNRLKELFAKQTTYDTQVKKDELLKETAKKEHAEHYAFQTWLEDFNKRFNSQRLDLQTLLAKPVFSRSIGQDQHTYTMGDLLSDITDKEIKNLGKSLTFSKLYELNKVFKGDYHLALTGLQKKEVSDFIQGVRTLVDKGLIVGYCPITKDKCHGEISNFKLLAQEGFKFLEQLNEKSNYEWYPLDGLHFDRSSYYRADYDEEGFPKRYEEKTAENNKIYILAKNSGDLFWDKLKQNSTPEGAKLGFSFKGFHASLYDVDLFFGVTLIGARTYAELIHPPIGLPLVKE